MYIVYVHHECKPGMLDAAIGRVDTNGDLMSRIPGFLFRYRTRDLQNENKVSTVTGWKDEAAYDAWLAEKAKLPPDAGGSPYIKVVNERHACEKYHGPQA